MTDIQRDHARTTLVGIRSSTIAIYRWAVYASFAFIIAGFLLVLFTDHEVDTQVGSPANIVSEALKFHPAGFFGIGIGLMILAPIVMLVNAAITFFRKDDKRFGVITLIVAGVLMLSVAIAYIKESL